MHPRNRYNVKPDFGKLAEFRPSLKPFLIAKKRSTPDKERKSSTSQSAALPYALNFSDPAALRELTCAVLERDFDLKLEIPLDRLIPTVPQKLNYIHWIEDLLYIGQSSSSGDGDKLNCGDIPKGDSVIGIDIGTGTSCIYPLLGCKMNGWRFLATDIDSEAVKFAIENVKRNGFTDKIEVKQVSASTMLLGAVDTTMQYSFCMCNPPFFKDKEDRYGGSSRSESRPAPSTFTGATMEETVTEGGEEEFVRRIIQDSLVLRMSVRWYSSMLGKKANMKTLLSELNLHQVPVVTSTEFVQGKTWRWAIAWSFDDTLKEKVKMLAKSAKVSRQRPITIKISPSDISQLDTSSTLTVSPSRPGEESFHKVRKWLLEKLKELQIDITDSDDTESRCQDVSEVQYHCKASKNTWSHQRRKKRLLARLHGARAQLEQQQQTSTDDTGTLQCESESLDKSSSHLKSAGNKTETQASSSECVPEALHESENDSTREKSGETQTSLSSEVEANTSSGSSQLGSVSDLSFEELQQQTEREIEAFCPPCTVEFECSLHLEREQEEQTAPKKKRPRTKKKQEAATKEVHADRGDGFSFCLEFEWIQGDDKDLLHQIVQYFKNRVQDLKSS